MVDALNGLAAVLLEIFLRIVTGMIQNVKIGLLLTGIRKNRHHHRYDDEDDGIVTLLKKERLFPGVNY